LVHDTTAPSFSGLACTDDDAPGAVYAFTDNDADGSLAPASLTATTVKAYSVPPSRPPTMHDVSVVVQVSPPGVAVTV
jgi:hypothetical protein